MQSPVNRGCLLWDGGGRARPAVQGRKVPAQPRADVLPFGKLCWSQALLCILPPLRMTSSVRIHKTDSNLAPPTFSALYAQGSSSHRRVGSTGSPSHAGTAGPQPRSLQRKRCLLPGHPPLPQAPPILPYRGRKPYVSTEMPQEKRQQSRYPQTEQSLSVGMRHGAWRKGETAQSNHRRQRRSSKVGSQKPTDSLCLAPTT